MGVRGDTKDFGDKNILNIFDIYVKCTCVAFIK